jgi:hypothetical protein
MVIKRPMVEFLTKLLLAIRWWFARRARLEAENRKCCNFENADGLPRKTG